MNPPSGEPHQPQRLIRPTTVSVAGGGNRKPAQRRVPIPLTLDNADGGLEVSIGDTDFVAFGASTAESLRSLVSRAWTPGHGPRTVAVTSAVHGEGTTFTSRALAAVLAHDRSAPVCWVDVNWWKRNDASPMLRAGSQTIAEIVVGNCSVDDAVQGTSLSRLSALSAGPVPAGSRSMVANSDVLATVIERLEAMFEMVVLDLPPVLATSDALVLARLVDAFVLVVGKGIASSSQVTSALETMNGVPFLGSILNTPSTRRRRKRR